jgi:hypothetical protein
VVVIEHNSTIPVQSHKSPGEWTRDGSDVDESRMRVVAEIEERQVEEVDDQDELSPSKVASDEEHNESKLQEVVENEVASYTSSSLDILSLV